MLLIFLSLLPLSVHLNDDIYRRVYIMWAKKRDAHLYLTHANQVSERPVRMPELVKAHQEGRVRARARAST